MSEVQYVRMFCNIMSALFFVVSKIRVIYPLYVTMCIRQVVKRFSVVPWSFGGPCTIPKASSYYVLMLCVQPRVFYKMCLGFNAGPT